MEYHTIKIVWYVRRVLSGVAKVCIAAGSCTVQAQGAPRPATGGGHSLILVKPFRHGDGVKLNTTSARSIRMIEKGIILLL